MDRKRWLALLLTLLFPGLGHVYCGEPKRGVVLYLIFLVSAILLLFVTPVALPMALNIFVPVFIAVGFYLYIYVDAARLAGRLKGNFQPKPYNKWYVYILLIVVLQMANSTLFETPFRNAYRSRMQAFKIPSGGMIPTLLIGDHITVNMRIYGKSAPQRGDVAVFREPSRKEKDFIERVVGLPGETLEMRDTQVFIDGQPIDESAYAYYMLPDDYTDERRNFDAYQIPEGCYFMLGDNRDNSSDSRVFGVVPVELIKGKAYQIYWSWNGDESNVRWGRIGRLIE